MDAQRGVAVGDLLAEAGVRGVVEHPGTVVTGVCDDTRAVERGWLFVPRGKAGLARAGEAAAAGAVVVRPRDGEAFGQPEAGRIAAAFFGHPARALTLLAVTGTNGKTTVASLVQQLLAGVGRRCGLLGTAGNDLGDGRGLTPAALTTPGAIDLQRLLRAMADAGCTHVSLEASSHALDQGRLDGLHFAAAMFTNLSQDHLDYHGDMAAYAAAKARLFAMLSANGAAVINVDDAAADAMVRAVAGGVRVIRTSVRDAEAGASGLIDGVALPVARWPLPGRFNVSNVTQAVAAVHAVTGTPLPALARLAEGLRGVRGRMERVLPAGVDPSACPVVLVDYAHTPDALARATEAARTMVVPGGRLITLYGCGGDRDRTKRPRMTAAALAGSDTALLTSDNPRTEDPEQIFEDAMAGFADDPRLTLIADRAAAIAQAIGGAGAGDVVLITGKGHETYQIVGTERLDFDDAAVAREVLAAR